MSISPQNAVELLLPLALCLLAIAVMIWSLRRNDPVEQRLEHLLAEGQIFGEPRVLLLSSSKAPVLGFLQSALPLAQLHSMSLSASMSTLAADSVDVVLIAASMQEQAQLRARLGGELERVLAGGGKMLLLSE